MAELWSYKCGKKGVSRVRAYERSNSNCLYVEWYWKGRRYQRSLKSDDGHPVTDRDLAMRIARRMSDEMEADHNRQAALAFFGGSDRTVGALFAAIHAARGRGWSESHRRDQERYRAFWTRQLGKETKLTDVNAALVESIGQRHASDWTPATHRHYLRYVTSAFRYAERKLKWITDRHNLSAVDLPNPKSKSKSYTLAEVRRLLAALEDVSPRAAWIGHVAWQTGRRLTAIRTLPESAVEVMDGHTVLHFPSITDKAKQSGDVPVVGKAHELGREITDWSVPSMEQCQDWLREAEKAAGIAHQKGRSWHAIKRRWATESRGMVGRDKQAGTLGATLDRHYVQDDMDPKLAVARAMAERL